MYMKERFYKNRKMENIPPSILFRMLKDKKSNELNAFKKNTLKLEKTEEEKYNNKQIEALNNELNFINEFKTKCKTGLIKLYMDSLMNKIETLEKENECPSHQIKLKEIKGKI